MLPRFVLAVALLCGALGVPGASTHAAPPPTIDPCPPRGMIKEVGDASTAIAGAFGAIRRLFPQINYGQGRTDPVTRRTTLVREVVELNRRSPDALRFRKLAARRCGAATARQSWAVVVLFPLAAMASASQFAFFVVDTSKGWKLYGTVYDYH